MNTKLTFFTILISIILVTGCSKTVDVVVSEQEKVAQLLTGNIGNKVWRLSKVYQNNNQVALTPDQLKYTKTYTIDVTQKLAGKFTNSGGDYGEWFITGDRTYAEIITTVGGNQARIDFIIREISTNSLDVQYTSNSQTIREVYYGF